LTADGETLTKRYLSESGYDATMARLRALDAEGTRTHLHCIRLTERRPSRAMRSPADDTSSNRDADPWVSEAIEIADTVRTIADESAGDGVDWIGIRGLNGSARRGLQFIGWDLYSGRCGIAPLFAALESRGLACREPSFALRLLQPLVDAVLENRSFDAGTTGFAIGALGTGGVVYGLTLTSTLLGNERLLTAASRAAASISVDEIARDLRFDVIFGAAGAALGLLALHRVRPESWILDRAVECGRHLLCHARNGISGGLAWRNDGARVVRGFAHGAAGVAYALARLYEATDTTAFRDAAIATLCHVPSVAAAEADRRRPAAGMQWSWCQGMAGLGLAQLEVSRFVGRPDVVGGLEHVLSELAAPSNRLSPSDQVCCGNVGSLELLSRASDVLGENQWRDAATARATETLARATDRGSYAVSAIDDKFSPGYYQGLSGIGYELLRLRWRDLPSVLLWE